MTTIEVPLRQDGEVLPVDAEELEQLAEAWRPWRTWVTVMLRALGGRSDAGG